MRCWGPLAAAWLLLIGWLVPTSADAGQLQDDLRKLFELGADRTAAGQQAARDHWRALRTKQPEPEVDYAYALVLLQQYQYEPALKVLDHILQRQVDDLAIERTRIWVQVFTRRYEPAMANMVALAQRFPQPADPQVDKPWRDTADFLGCMAGFMAGPQGDRVNQTLLGEHENQILAALDPQCRTHFERGRQAVLEQYRDLQRELRLMMEVERAAQAQAIEAERKVLEQEKEEYESSKDLAVAKSELLSGERQELRELTMALARMKAQYVNTQRLTEALAVQYEVAKEVYRDLNDFFPQEGDSVHPGSFQLRVAERRAAYRDMLQLANELKNANAELLRLTMVGQELSAKQQALLARQQLEGGKLQRTVNQLRQTQRQLVGKQAGSSNRGDSPRVLALKKQMQSLSTYDPLPLLAERDRVVQAVAEK